MSKNKKRNFQPKKKSSPVDKLVNAIIAVVILVVLGLAVWAVSPKFTAKIEQAKASQKAQEPDTIKKRAEEKGLSVEQFISDYGITGDNINGDTMMSEVTNKMTVENYAKLTDTTVEDFISSNSLPSDKVTGDMTVEEADKLVPLKKVVESSGMDFASFKAQYGLADDVTEDTPWVDVQETVMAAAQAQQQAAQAASASPETAAAESEAPEASEAPTEKAAE